MDGASGPKGDYGDFLVGKYREISKDEKGVFGELKDKIVETLKGEKISKSDEEIKLLATQAFLIFKSTSSGKKILEETSKNEINAKLYIKGDHSKQDLIDRISETVVHRFQSKISLSETQIKNINAADSKATSKSKGASARKVKGKDEPEKKDYKSMLTPKDSVKTSHTAKVTTPPDSPSHQPTEVHTPHQSPKKEQATVIKIEEWGDTPPPPQKLETFASSLDTYFKGSPVKGDYKKFQKAHQALFDVKNETLESVEGKISSLQKAKKGSKSKVAKQKLDFQINVLKWKAAIIKINTEAKYNKTIPSDTQVALKSYYDHVIRNWTPDDSYWNVK